MNPSTYDRIRERAYQLWETDGSKHGEDWKYWLQAEREITGSNKHDFTAMSPKPFAEKKTVARKAAVSTPSKKATSKASVSSKLIKSKPMSEKV